MTAEPPLDAESETLTADLAKLESAMTRLESIHADDIAWSNRSTGRTP